jgi:hypothetical protein
MYLTKAPAKATTKTPITSPTKSPTKPPSLKPTKILTRSPTKPPTNAPTKALTKAPVLELTCGDDYVNYINREANVVNYINSVTLSKQTLSLYGSSRSPLVLALWSLVGLNDRLYELSPCIEEHKKRLNQRFAYLALMYSAGGRFLEYPTIDECRWRGISCTGSTVTGVDFLGSSLFSTGGTIPADVGLWSNLTSFRVSAGVRGSLPSFIGLWTSLTRFDVGVNEFTGTVPTEVSKWTSINSVSIKYNMLNGTLPAFGNNFCPKNGTGPTGDLWANCEEIVCDCCSFCCANDECCNDKTGQCI